MKRVQDVLNSLESNMKQMIGKPMYTENTTSSIQQQQEPLLA